MLLQATSDVPVFEDGFVTGVFSRAFNDNAHKIAQSPKGRLFDKWLEGSGGNEAYTQDEFELIKGAVESGVATPINGDTGQWSGGSYQGYDFTGDSTLADAVGKGYVIFDNNLAVVGAVDRYDFGGIYYPVNSLKLFGADDYNVSYGPTVCPAVHAAQGFCN